MWQQIKSIQLSTYNYTLFIPQNQLSFVKIETNRAGFILPKGLVLSIAINRLWIFATWLLYCHLPSQVYNLTTDAENRYCTNWRSDRLA